MTSLHQLAETVRQSNGGAPADDQDHVFKFDDHGFSVSGVPEIEAGFELVGGLQ